MKKLIVIAGVIAIAAFGAKKYFESSNDEPIEYFPPAEDERLAA